jgi:ABC-type Fe3+ transport system permease subunit
MSEPSPNGGDRVTDSAPSAPRRRRRGRLWWIAGIAIAALVVIILAPLASRDPDGLQRVAKDQGFIGQAQNVVSGLLSGYAIPGVNDPVISTILSGLAGLAIVFVAIVLVGRLLARRRV